MGVLLAVFILVAGFVVGSAGQSAVPLGAAAEVSVSAAVIGASGGVRESQPIRVSLRVGLINNGSSRVRVVGSWADTVTTAIAGVIPAVLSLDAGSAGQLTLDVALRCTWPAELTLPALRVEAPNGQPVKVPVAGAQALTQACTAGAATARPMALVSATPVADDRTGLASEQGRLDLTVRSPTGRGMRVRQIRAGGQELPMIPVEPVVSSSVVTIGVRAPAGCPAAWKIMGIPSTVTLDLTGGAQITLLVGKPLTDWLLRTTCPPDRPR
jgi:hypothetical protein